MIQVSKKDLKKISYDFRVVASRLLRSDYDDAVLNIKRFLAHTEGNQILMSFINGCKSSEIDFAKAIKRDRYEAINVPTDSREEVWFVYGLLRYVVDKNIDLLHLTHGYGSGNKIQAHVDAFNNRVVSPFVQHLEGHLRELMIDAGVDDSAVVQIDVNGGQIQQLNVSTGASQLIASNSSGNSETQIHRAFSDLIKLLEERRLDSSIKSEVHELGELIVAETSKKEPKKSIVRAGYERMEALATTLVLASESREAIVSFVELVKKFFH